jgi:photosystem II stability/assembly factor-like uncharacterized protein
MLRGRAMPFFWLTAAAVLFVFFSYLAFRREPWPGAFGTPLSARWWATVVQDLPGGLPAYNVSLNSVTVLPGTNTFVAVGGSGGIVRSLDGGKTWGHILWTGRSSDFLQGVSFADANTGWAVGEGGVILKMEKAGDVQQRQEKGVRADLYAVKAISRSRAVAVGQAGAILTTDDGGQRWQLQSSGVVSNLFSVDFRTPLDGLAVGNDGIVLRTADGGKTWSKIDVGLEDQLLCVRFFGQQTAWIAGGKGRVLRSADGGGTWSGLDAGTERDLFAIVASGQSQAIAVGTGVILSTSDARRWKEIRNPLNSRLFSVEASNSGVFVAVGARGSILTSDIPGTHWKPRSVGGAGTLEDVAWTDGGALIAGNDGQLLASNSNGRSYQIRHFSQGVSWDKLTFAPDGLAGLAIGTDHVSMKIFRTDNGGHSWRELGKLSDQIVSDGVLVDDSHAWVAGNKLWRSTDGGATWQSPQNAPTFPFAVAFANSKRGVVARYPGQFFVTEDGGETWDQAISGPAETLAEFALDRIVYVDRDHAWAVGTDGLICHTEDGGHHWTVQDTDQHVELTDIRFLKDRIHGWIVGLDGVFGTTTNGGATWNFTRVTDHVLIAVSFRDANRGTAVGWGGEIIQTSNGGKTWTDYEPPWWPSPWYYGSWLLVALVAAPAFRRPPPERAPESTIANKLISDRPLEAGEQDALGLAKVARGLSRFLRNEHTVPPLTVAITGEWGSGKSSLMNLLAADLRANGFRPVFFNAWHNQQEQSVLASLFEAIRKKGLPSVGTVEGLIFRTRLLLRRFARHWRMLLLLGIFVAVSAGLLEVRPLWLTNLWDSVISTAPGFIQALKFPAGKDTPAWLAFVASVITAIGLLLKSLRAFGIKPEELLAQSAQDTTRKPYHLRFAEQFHDVAAALAPRRMVIFVDDLDRCRPQYVLDTLEAINFLISSGECFIVMGLAPEQVKAAVGLAFKEVAEEMVKLQSGTTPVEGDSKDEQSRRKREEYARQYLYKLVNMEIPVPAVGSSSAANVLAGKGVETRTESGLLSLFKPYAAVVAFSAVLIGSFFAAQIVAKDIEFAMEARKVHQEPIGTVQTTAASPVPAAEKASGKPTNQATKVQATTGTVGLPPGFVPARRPHQHPIRYLGALPLVMVWIASLIWILRLRISVVVRDSPRFTNALEHWQPVLSQIFRTPRSLKRFMNKVRYLAMLQRFEPPEHTVFAAIARRLHHAHSEDAQIVTGKLSETALVGLAAIDEASVVPGIEHVEEIKAAHLDQFGDALDAAERAKYEDLTQRLKVG